MKTRRTTSGATVVAMIALALLSGCADEPEALLASAKNFLGKNDRAAAILQLKNALQKNPDLAEARLLLGKAVLEAGESAAAQKELRKALDLNYPADQVIPQLAEAMLRSGDGKKMVAEFGKAEMTTPEARAELQTTLGRAYLTLRNVEASKTAFVAALAAQPDYPPALLGQAQLAASQGDLPGALALAESALAKVPTLRDGWQTKGDILVAQGELEPALAAYRKAIETKPDQVSAHAAIVMLLTQQGKAEEAGKEFAAMRKVAPANPQTLYLQALLAYRDKNYAGARDAIQLHLKAAPGNLSGVLLGAQIDYQLGSYAKAEAALDTVLQRAPRNAAARRMLVQTNLKNGRPRKALEALQPLLQDAKVDSNTFALAGEVYAQNGDTATAARYFGEAARLDPANPGKRAVVGLLHVQRGDTEQGLAELEAAASDDKGVRADLALVMLNLRQRKFDSAMAAVDAIEKKQPDKPLSHNLRGAVLLAKRDVAGARRSFERALALDPVYFPAVEALARLDLAEKKPEDAKKRFEAVLAKEPKNVGALLAIAALRGRAGGPPDEVAALIAKAIAAAPADPTPRLNLISLYIRNKQPAKAIAAAQEALAALPDQPDILDAAGQSYRAAGDLNQAIRTYNKLAAVRPDSPVPLLRLAEVQIADKDPVAARESARKALAIKPDSVEAHRILIALDLDAKKDPSALAMARDMQKQRPNESIGYLLEGDIRGRQKALVEAAAAYRNGLKKVGTTDLAIRLNMVLDASGSFAEAEKFAAAWLKDHPTDLQFLHFKSQQALARKDYAAAVTQYKAILEIQPNDVLALNNLAWVSGQLKDPKALEYAERANELAPGTPAVLDTLGVLLLEKGEAARAVELLQKAVASSPNNAETRLHFAQALIKVGQKDAAKKELDTLAKLGEKFPGHAEVAKLRNEFPVAPEVAKEREEAARDVERLQKSVAAAPNAAAMRLKLAQAMIRAGQTDAARKELETLAKLGAKFDDQAEVAKLMRSL